MYLQLLAQVLFVLTLTSNGTLLANERFVSAQKSSAKARVNNGSISGFLQNLDGSVTAPDGTIWYPVLKKIDGSPLPLHQDEAEICCNGPAQKDLPFADANCPFGADGIHLPSIDEFKTLRDQLGYGTAIGFDSQPVHDDFSTAYEYVSSSTDKAGNVFMFNSADASLSIGSKANLSAARCVGRAPSPPPISPDTGFVNHSDGSVTAPDGLIWYPVVKNKDGSVAKMSWSEAIQCCNTGPKPFLDYPTPDSCPFGANGVHLPSLNEFEILRYELGGRGVSWGPRFDNKSISDLAGQAFWSGSPMADGASVWVFNGGTGALYGVSNTLGADALSKSEIAVRCVGRPPQPQPEPPASVSSKFTKNSDGSVTGPDGLIWYPPIQDNVPPGFIRNNSAMPYYEAATCCNGPKQTSGFPSQCPFGAKGAHLPSRDEFTALGYELGYGSSVGYDPTPVSDLTDVHFSWFWVSSPDVDPAYKSIFSGPDGLVYDYGISTQNYEVRCVRR